MDKVLRAVWRAILNYGSSTLVSGLKRKDGCYLSSIIGSVKVTSFKAFGRSLILEGNSRADGTL
jgi:hypothetical protein